MLTTNPFDDDHLREECGVFGIYGHPEAAALTALGLHALQHRGQEAAGIVAHDGDVFHNHRDLGHVEDCFGSESIIRKLKGAAAVGHVRYSTTGETLLRNVQPLFAEMEFGGLALAHNGNLTNTNVLRRSLVKRGCLFQSTTDTEVIIHLIAISLYTSVEDRLIDALRQIEGAYSLTCLTKDGVMGVRDPLGIRPLVLGKLDGAWCLASETCAFDIIGAEFVRDVEPGEIVVISATGLRSLKPFAIKQRRFCIFEYIYFARPDSIMEGTSVYDVRKRIGAQLARESAVDADVIIPVPDSGVPAAIGYAAQAGIPFELGIIRNHYVGRTFIQPTDRTRHVGVKMKHNPNRHAIEGKRVVLVDDSIVRGTTSRKIVEMVRQAGASEVHMRISSPPTNHCCYFGIDTPEREKLLAARYDVDGMAKLIGVDSLAFISLDGLYKAVGEEARNPAAPQYCDACFTGDYPIMPTDYADQLSDPKQLSLLGEAGK
ncbi:amidophosphoribosyltransferase [Magnetospirillum gryphiswaldense]|uniref:Amidophosphoribosyltransferase n=2 Tax=Magnetospirillum gryphiswaldense TaxID=55518 RepID=V6F342_MAGGM|nr:amidophosphoribosyltransferase [Magnetospirillum gryphiswaldense]AVM73250.1 Amidophosphoribosyltransferase precursor [Magnetospirillum gryphiswaldense MSR-1]AVM77153.1 Amidophosphoribosyltransferase precursor [Magnetospirillum gryphiswaldense]CAM75895.1 Amidophosphoribosyl transferase [Magnetospirillum gryphiswaldense MSR-1]CDK98716.1 Amidophosphoribosyltransferase precursor (Glutamine phosphoribosylpyrophosphate amidotransferase) (ATASE) (GPATase) [Magnetospirillum gryphiswaldense MSR-1 v2]